MKHGVVLFYTTSSAMRTEKLLEAKAFNIKLIPTPRQFSSDCGVALRFDWEQLEKVKEVLDTAQVENDAIREM